MSRPMNMLRTRRKDCNVKPNRRDSRLARLDRKSSRGMLYENEELRLKTININAEVESRQSDIKKLKRENEMLKKGLWYLRDEYDKLERLIKDKKIDFSSSSTTCSSSSDTESNSSCSEESEEVETTQNLKNVQRTNLKNMQDQFDHLSVVTEETSAENENSEHSNRASLPNENFEALESDVIKPDQSYPVYKNLTKSQTLPVQDKVPMNFFSPIKTSKSFDDNYFNQTEDTIYPGEYYADSMGGGQMSSLGNIAENSTASINGMSNGDIDENFMENMQQDSNCEIYLSKKIVKTNASNFYQNMVLVPKSTKPQPEANCMEKSSTDLIVKIDNQNFSNNGMALNNTPTHSSFSNGGNLEELLNEIESISQRGINVQYVEGGMYQRNGYEFLTEVQREDLTFMENPVMDHLMNENEQDASEKYKSELNVVLMPNPMSLIGFDKYRNIQRSFESINSPPLEELSASQQNLCVIPPPIVSSPDQNLPQVLIEDPNLKRACDETNTNPFFFGHLKDNYVNSDFFSMRYNPDNFAMKEEDQKKDSARPEIKSASKTNLLDITSSEHISSENEENIRFKTSPPEKPEANLQLKPEPKQPPAKTPKLSIRRKVSIHFKGKKDKSKKITDSSSEASKPKTPGEKKHSLFDIRFSDGDKGKNKDKNKVSHQKTPSIESKKSTTETSNQEAKTPTSSDSKTSNEKKTASAGDKKDASSEKKPRKSISVSPDRIKHVQLKEEGSSSKKHKKHKKSDRSRTRRPSIIIDPRSYRERSFSVCTDRSNTLEHRLALGLGFGSSFLYDDYSDRERTNSLSSCDTAENGRKLSRVTDAQLRGKVPWCGCWGNGCL